VEEESLDESGGAILRGRVAENYQQTISGPPGPADEADELPAGDVLQQLTRSRTADGSQCLEGWLRMPLDAGQRTGSLHVAFCPPFPQTPELEFEQLAGPEARIKVAQLQPYGVRLDVKLVAAAGPGESVLVQFAARG